MKEKTLRLKTSLRIVIIILLFSIGITNLFAEHVEPSVARNVASTFLRNNGAKSEQLTDVSAKAGFSNLYIFNGENGFVIVAADDRVRPILGYSLTDRFVTENMPENLRFWFQGYNDEIQYAIDNQIRTSEETAYEWDDLKNGKLNVARTTVIVEPLIHSEWGQDEPYNELCPNDYPTGCVATAMAQIMYYYKYPSQGYGSHSYSWNNTTLNADFENTTYDWTNMTDTYNSSSSEIEKTAVATLMYHCGVSVNMNYGPTVSLANLLDAEQAYKEYFGYSYGLEFKDRDSYNDSYWKSMLKTELNAGRPLQYQGTDANGENGHSFVCDGYDSEDMFHFNWGWEQHSANNAYYTLDNLVPIGESYVFNDNQGAIFGIEPYDTEPSLGDCLAPTGFYGTISGRTITLNWVAATDVNSYRVYRNDELIASNVTGTSYVDNSLDIGVYRYYLRSNCADGSISEISSIIEKTIPYQGDVDATIGDLNYTLNEQKLTARVKSHKDGSSASGSLIIPSSVTYINSYGQSHTYSVTEIKNNAFSGCSGITSISLPNSLQSIGRAAFNGTGWYKSQPNGIVYLDNWCIAYKGNISSLTGSVSLNSNIVGIADEALSSCCYITTITIPNTVTSIGDGAFNYCTGLTSITIPYAVTRIGENAFGDCNNLTTVYWNAENVSYYKVFSSHPFNNCNNLNSVIFGNTVRIIPRRAFIECSNITSLEIGNSVTDIGDYAFAACSGLSSVTLPNTVINIGDYAFAGSSLISITIPNHVTSIGDSAFGYCDDLALVYWNAVNVSNYYPAFTDCTALSTVVFGNSVQTIPPRALYGCSSITSVTMPNAITSIEDYTFYGCSGLTSITIPNSVTNIGQRAFCGCSSLMSIIIPNNVVKISQYAFSGCSSLESVALGNSVATIESYVFNDCNSSATIYWNAENVTSYPTTSSPFEDFTNMTVIFGDNVQMIPQYAFNSCSGLKSVSIGNSVTSIDRRVFYDCDGLTSVTIPNSVISIGAEAFSCCDGLTSVTIPNSVTNIGISAFSYCTGLASITIPNSVTIIGDSAFTYCSSLTIVYWNAENVTDYPLPSPLRKQPFDGCTNLSTVIFGDSVLTIPDYAFYDHDDLVSVYVGEMVTNIGECAFEGCSGLTSLSIGNSVAEIGSGAFVSCTGLTSVTIPYSVTTIGEAAFNGCSHLTTVYWNAENVAGFYDSPFSYCNNLTEVVFGSSVQTIPEYALAGVSSLVSLTIGGSVTSIGRGAFDGCWNGLTTITIPTTVTNIGTDAFANCSNLKTVYWNAENVADFINRGPFNYCNNLEEVVFGNSVRTIPAYAFYGRSSLTGSLTIPNTITSIGNNAFYNCSGIDAVYYTGNIEEWCSISFENHFSNPLLCAHNLYIDNELLTSLVIPETLTEIKDYTFYNCSSMTDLSIPNTITSIGYCAFYQCEGLSGCLNIPNSVTDIGDDAFYGCSELTSVVLPTSLETINSYTFGDCTSLTALAIPNSVINIDNCAFYRCTNLNYIRVDCLMPPTLNQYAFYGVDRSIPVFVPCGTQEGYKSADYWSEFETINESQYNLVVTQNDELGGNVSVLKYADCDDNHCAIYAEPNIGYVFDGWWIDDELSAPYQFVDFTLTEDVAFEARFVRQEYHEVATGASTIWSNPQTWDNGEVPTSISTVGIRNNVVVDIDATVEALGVYDNSVLTIRPGVTLTVNDTLGSINESSIIIEDGGQLVHSSKEALATLKKSIEPYTSDDDGWNLISFPLTGNGTVASVENMLSNQYDLYYYDEPTYTWINQKDEANGFTELEEGKGYLYANIGTGVGVEGTKIGDGSSKTAYSPFYTYYNYSIAENLFLASELEAASLPTTELSALCWYATNESGYQQDNVSIWMANVDDSELTSTSHNVSDMTLVYTGSMTPEIGWNEFVFNESEFAWDGTSNILVCVQRNNGDYNKTINWQSHDPGFAAMSYKYNDNNAYDMASETYSMTTSSTLRPNTIFQTVEQIGQFEYYESITMSFAGEIENGSAEVTVPLSYTGGNSLSGFNLVGNPFVHNVTSYETTNVADGCFRVNDAKTNLIVSSISELNPLRPAEGFFVKATGDKASVTFNSPTRKAEDNRGLIRLEIVESDKIVDRLIVKKDGEPLKKISLQGRHTELFARNNENGKLSIVSLEGDEQPVNFKAARMGSYTITANIENLELDYLHLIDNLTGKNIDLLLDKDYTFYSSTDDNEYRFRLIFNPNALVEDDEIFAYQYGDDIIVNGNGTLQVFDVLGRFVANYQINGVERVCKPSSGVYILRMIGENMKTQKIIVK